ncbi:MAG TPA: hypothetical protein VMR49_00425 [Candidatus Paceibacterota bacterium]|nr:hypothetical protein [Candidatus Paceibacterota bacterium]
MRKERTLFLIGLWVAILPFLGFPNSWREVFFVITGFALIYLAYLFHIEAKARLPKSDDNSQTFVDNINNGV